MKHIQASMSRDSGFFIGFPIQAKEQTFELMKFFNENNLEKMKMDYLENCFIYGTCFKGDEKLEDIDSDIWPLNDVYIMSNDNNILILSDEDNITYVGVYMSICDVEKFDLSKHIFKESDMSLLYDAKLKFKLSGEIQEYFILN